MIDKVKFLKKIYYMNMKKYIAIAIVVIFLSAIPLAMHSSAGSNSNNIPYATSYNATINEKGLPSGTTWSFALGTHIYTTSNSSYSIPLADGTYGLGVNSVYTYPITINSPPSGTGNYQQLITLSNPSQYGINSKSSNFYIADSNGSLLYTWIQSYNSTSLTMWTKMPYNTSQVELQVLPSFENVLSATGYIGEWNTTTDNGKMVFPVYQSWAGLSSVPSGWLTYGNASDTIITYHSTHITLTTTGNAVNNPYTAVL